MNRTMTFINLASSIALILAARMTPDKAESYLALAIIAVVCAVSRAYDWGKEINETAAKTGLWLAEQMVQIANTLKFTGRGVVVTRKGSARHDGDSFTVTIEGQRQ